MGWLTWLKRRNRQIDDWLLAHPVLYFIVLAAAPVLAIVGLAWVRSEPLSEALVEGLVFGVVYASVFLIFRGRWR